MITAKEATKHAIDFIADLYDANTDLIRSIRVEEIVDSDNHQDWVVTLSFVPPGELPDEEHRLFKVFHVNGATGMVESMRIRELSRG